MVDTAVLRDTASDVGRICAEFESATSHSERVGTAVGHSGLASRIEAFASNWDHRRAELVEQLTALHDNLVTVADGFETTDRELGETIAGKS